MSGTQYAIKVDSEGGWQIVDRKGYCLFGVLPGWSEGLPGIDKSSIYEWRGKLSGGSQIDDPAMGWDVDHMTRGRFYQTERLPEYIGLTLSETETILTYLRFDHGCALGVELRIVRVISSRCEHKRAFIAQEGNNEFTARLVSKPLKSREPFTLSPSSDQLARAIDESSLIVDRSRHKIRL